MGMYQLHSVRHRIFNKSFSNNRAQLYKGFRKNKKVGEDMEQQIFEYLTPLGKITVIKTNLISQCVHLLSTIPRSESFLRTLNTILYKFLWNGKPDKITRSTISLSYMQGGMKMINIHNFDKALKISWIKKLVTQPNSQWYKLLTVMYENINKTLIFGDQWYNEMSLTVHNQFWHNILKDWQTLKKIQQAQNESELLRNCIWYNSQISKNTIFFPDWYKKGIYLVNDIINTEGKILSIRDLKYKFNINVNILNYYTIKAKIELYTSKYRLLGNLTLERPTYPFHLDVLLKAKSGSKNYYHAFNNAEALNDNPTCEIKWTNIVQNKNLDIEIKERWKQIYKICFYSVCDNNVIWFQYRILNGILGTKDYLKKLKIDMNNACSFCGMYDENLEHLFCKCREVTQLWDNIQQWINNKLGENLVLTNLMKLHGYLQNDQKFWPLNLILMITRKYIFWCAKKTYKLNIYFLQNEIKNLFGRRNIKPDKFTINPIRKKVEHLEIYI